MQQNLVEVQRKLNAMDREISIFLEENEMNFGGIDEDITEANAHIWKQYKQMCNERKKVSYQLSRLLGRGYT